MTPSRPGLRILVAWLAAATLMLDTPAGAAVTPVTDCGDSGLLTQLRSRISAASNNDVLVLPACTITLAGAANEDNNASGDLDIIANQVLTIVGAGPNRTIIDGGGTDRVFHVLSAGASLTLVGMTVRNGVSSSGGGGIRHESGSTLNLVDVAVIGNTSTAGGGGGIVASGPITLTGVTVSGNFAPNGGGGLLTNNASLIAIKSVFAGNRTNINGGGLNLLGTSVLTNVLIANNTAELDGAGGGSGGGFHATVGSGPVSLRKTIITRNTVGASGSGPDCSIAGGVTVASNGHNVVRTNCGIVAALGDQFGVSPALPSDLVIGAGPGGGPHVKVMDPATAGDVFSFFAYDPGFAGGVRVAGCDLDTDGLLDVVTAAGPGGGPHVRAFSGLNGLPLTGAIASFFPYPAGFTGGVFVGCADVNLDGVPDVITGAGPGGGPHVRAFSGRDGAEITGFFALSPGFTGGVAVGP